MRQSNVHRLQSVLDQIHPTLFAATGVDYQAFFTSADDECVGALEGKLSYKSADGTDEFKGSLLCLDSGQECAGLSDSLARHCIGQGDAKSVLLDNLRTHRCSETY
jgi:hypothetical protein